MKRRSQLSLLSTWNKDRFAFGGSMLKNSHAKTKRPFNQRLAIHVVMRSSRAVGRQSFLRCGRAIENALFEQAGRQSIRLRAAANSGNHLHLLVQAPSRDQLSDFLRAVSGRIARLATGSRRGVPQGLPFWDQRPFTRLVNPKGDFLEVCRYISLNSTETATGLARGSVRAMFREIREGLRRGQLLRSPGLVAAGFI